MVAGAVELQPARAGGAFGVVLLPGVQLPRQCRGEAHPGVEEARSAAGGPVGDQVQLERDGPTAIDPAAGPQFVAADAFGEVASVEAAQFQIDHVVVGLRERVAGRVRDVADRDRRAVAPGAVQGERAVGVAEQHSIVRQCDRRGVGGTASDRDRLSGPITTPGRRFSRI